MLWVKTMDVSRQSKRKTDKKQFLMWKNQGSVGADLDHLDAERAITTDPEDNRKRRTLQLTKQNNSWGFTLQTYGVKHKKTQEIDLMTYVDYVDIHGSAYMAGLRKGDVIVSVNGRSVELSTHQELVYIIKNCGEKMRLVVLFEDCCKKVELYDRIIKLKGILSYKIDELKALEMQEREILNGISVAHGLERSDFIRQSIYSKASSNSWDEISLISSPKDLPHQPHSWNTNSCSSDTYTKSSVGEENNSIDEPLDFDDSYIDITYADSDSDSGACVNNDECFESNQSKSVTEEIDQSLNLNGSDSLKSENSKCDSLQSSQSETNTEESSDPLVCGSLALNDTEDLTVKLHEFKEKSMEILKTHCNQNSKTEIEEHNIKDENSEKEVVISVEETINSSNSKMLDILIPFIHRGEICINETDEDTKL